MIYTRKDLWLWRWHGFYGRIRTLRLYFEHYRKYRYLHYCLRETWRMYVSVLHLRFYYFDGYLHLADGHEFLGMSWRIGSAEWVLSLCWLNIFRWRSRLLDAHMSSGTGSGQTSFPGERNNKIYMEYLALTLISWILLAEEWICNLVVSSMHSILLERRFNNRTNSVRLWQRI